MIWNPAGTGTGSDGNGNWDTTPGNNVWYDGVSTTSTWVNNDLASIGFGTTDLTTSPIITLDAVGGVTVSGITFNALGAGSTVGYTINDGSGTGADPLVVDSGSTITDNNTFGTTTINANLTNGAAFNLTFAGTGNMTIGGNVGVVGGGAAAMTVGNTNNASPQYFSGILTLNSATNNNLSALTINSGTTVLNTTASLRTRP